MIQHGFNITIRQMNMHVIQFIDIFCSTNDDCPNLVAALFEWFVCEIILD
jgi:hypothetical protein